MVVCWLSQPASVAVQSMSMRSSLESCTFSSSTLLCKTNKQNRNIHWFAADRIHLTLIRNCGNSQRDWTWLEVSRGLVCAVISVSDWETLLLLRGLLQFCGWFSIECTCHQVHASIRVTIRGKISVECSDQIWRGVDESNGGLKCTSSLNILFLNCTAYENFHFNFFCKSRMNGIMELFCHFL